MSAVLLREARPLVPAGIGALARADDLIDLLIRDGRIAALAPAGRLDAPDAKPVELGGRWLLPGLWDSHVHLGQLALARERVDLSGCAGAAEVAERFAAAVATGAGKLGPVIGVGFRDALWPDAPTPALLDAIPAAVVAISADVHTVWSNRLALASVGAAPEQWFAREQLAFDLGIAYGEVSPERVDRGVAAALDDAAARGVVGIVDFEMDDAGAAWARRLRAGFAPPIRIAAAVYPQHLDAAAARGQRSGAPIGDHGPVRGGPYKLFADGSLNTRTAWCDEPYSGSGGDTGIAVYSGPALGPNSAARPAPA